MIRSVASKQDERTCAPEDDKTLIMLNPPLPLAGCPAVPAPPGPTFEDRILASGFLEAVLGFKPAFAAAKDEVAAVGFGAGVDVEGVEEAAAAGGAGGAGADCEASGDGVAGLGKLGVRPTPGDAGKEGVTGTGFGVAC